ncbi:hypothetical protein ACX1HO_20570 [Yersinia enterocolitica]|uniref:hypothetical protein n=1 Tax=Yersinia enterocolitica TaxID=630 RepID=UPI0032F5C20D|nr:hypothetical protein [Yersinia enterocolitica]
MKCKTCLFLTVLVLPAAAMDTKFNLRDVNNHGAPNYKAIWGYELTVQNTDCSKRCGFVLYQYYGPTGEGAKLQLKSWYGSKGERITDVINRMQSDLNFTAYQPESLGYVNLSELLPSGGTLEQIRPRTPLLKQIKCNMVAQKVDLGSIGIGEKAKVVHIGSRIECNENTTVAVVLPSPSLEFTPGALTNVTTEPSSGLINVQKNRSTDISLVFDTSVSSRSEAGEYTQSLIVTTEIQ